MSPHTHTKASQQPFAGDDSHLLCPWRPGCAAELGGGSSLCLSVLTHTSQGLDVFSCQVKWGWEAPLGEHLHVKKTML